MSSCTFFCWVTVVSPILLVMYIFNICVSCISLSPGWCKMSLRPSIPLVVALLLFYYFSFYCIIFYCTSAAANKRISVLFCSPRYGCEVLRSACLSVCLSARISQIRSPNFQVFCTCCLWLSLSPLTAMQYVKYFRFCGWRYGANGSESGEECFVQFATPGGGIACEVGRLWLQLVTICNYNILII